MDWEVRRYGAEDAEAWNIFVGSTKQGTFLFLREYMDYHSDRFHDHSLMIFRHGHLFALLPANVDGKVLWSHQGLTYGGLLTNQKATVAAVCDIFAAVNAYLRLQGFVRVIYKPTPWIYHRLPSEEDLYALTNVCDARLSVRHVATTLCNQRLRFTESRKSGIRKAKVQGLTVCESNDLPAFWRILEDNLDRKYSAHPVHTLSEIQLLKARFPDQIHLYLAMKDDKPLGGTLIYETPQVVHTQYISASNEGKAMGALDVLFDSLLHDRYADVPYFDFGKSSNGDGHDLDRSLIFQKEGFGGRAVCYDWYEYDL